MKRLLITTWARLFARPKFRPLNQLLLEFGSNGLGVGNSNPESNGENRLLKSILSSLDRPTVWDVGANQGDFTGEAIRNNPGTRVFAFEPHPETFRRLAERHGSADQCQLFNFALGSSSATKELWDYSGHEQGSPHATFYPQIVSLAEGRKLKPLKIEIRSLDEVAHELSVDQIDFLKIDTEGHELECLRGAEEHLKCEKIGYVQFEFNAMHLDARAQMADFAQVLNGFKLYRILPSGLLKLDLRNPMTSNLFGIQNILAVSSGRPTPLSY